MAATTTPPSGGTDPGADSGTGTGASAPPRFSRAERRFHWVNATLFGIVMLTGSVLYIGQLSAIVGEREIVRTLHVYCGLAIPVVFLIALLPRWGRALRADIRRLDRWTNPHKFNRGQRINAAVLMGATAVMVGTGVIMRWFKPFPLDWRTGATFAHDWFAFVIWVFVLGHIWFGLNDPQALRAITKGAPDHRLAEIDETTGDPSEPPE